MNIKRLIEVCEQVSKDVENDAKDFDGKPFTGRTVGVYFGNHGAAINALSEILAELLKSLPPDKYIAEPEIVAGPTCLRAFQP